MNPPSQIALDPSALTAFAASLATLPQEEVRKAKQLFVRNAISDARNTIRSSRAMIIMFGIISIIPIFLIIFIPALISYKSLRRNFIEKLTNAVEVWGDDLGDDRSRLLSEIATL